MRMSVLIHIPSLAAGVAARTTQAMIEHRRGLTPSFNQRPHPQGRQVSQPVVQSNDDNAAGLHEPGNCAKRAPAIARMMKYSVRDHDIKARRFERRPK